MAFIGFRSAAEAEVAKKYFDNSFVGAMRISVEVSLGCGTRSLLLFISVEVSLGCGTRSLLLFMLRLFRLLDKCEL